jgi:hypothetical protein
MLDTLKIIQYNAGLNSHASTRPFFDSISPEEYPILAIQEPGFNKEGIPYCPKGYHIAINSSKGTAAKVCFMISRSVPPGDWTSSSTGCHVSTLRIQTQEETITLINVYSPGDTGPRITAWNDTQKVLDEVKGEVILLGDFNTHHPKWGGAHVPSKAQAEHLLIETTRRELRLLTLQGEATWRRGTQESVIDLTFATEDTANLLTRCMPREEWALTQDHIPIEIHISLGVNPITTTRKYALQKAEWDKIRVYLADSKWTASTDPITELHAEIQNAMETFCPKAKPSQFTKPQWSTEATTLIKAKRQAKRKYHAYGGEHDLCAYNQLSKRLRKQIQSTSRANWRRHIAESTSDLSIPHNRGLWKLASWSRKRAGRPAQDPHIPPLRRTTQDTATDDNLEKARILAEKFFPPGTQAYLGDIETQDDGIPDTNSITLDITPEITKEELQKLIKHLPNQKAPGPDNIQNEALQQILPDIAEELAREFSQILETGQIPLCLKESTTIVLKKEQKADYSLPGSYRPIALENTLAKLLEKVVADKITAAVEEHNLLPWNQMGARKQRSTLSAIDLLVSTIQTAWKAKKGTVVSMLSLDLSGAFDNVSHERLLWTMSNLGLPQWMIRFTANFLKGRRTRISQSGTFSGWIPTESGIPQGSTLSPILFLIFISDLLTQLNDPSNNSMAVGFVDDTNLIAWGPSAASNCEILTRAHNICLTWAFQYGAKFAPEKYHLIHFTRKRRDHQGDLQSCIRIENHEIKAEQTVKILGVIVDSKLKWKEHIKRTAEKGQRAFEALSRITASTWGPSVQRARLVYSAVVRPTMLYGSQIWGIKGDGTVTNKGVLQPLKVIQNKCLRRVLGAYKRTPTTLLEREAQILPIDLQIDLNALQRAAKTANHQAQKDIEKATQTVWSSLQTKVPEPQSRRGRGRPRQANPSQPETGSRLLRNRMEERIVEMMAYRSRKAKTGKNTRRRRTRNPRRKERLETTLLVEWADLTWKKRWEEKRKENHRATAWHTPWRDKPLKLYSNLPKHEATALFLLRSETIGLNSWLASINVPDVHPSCPCGWAQQTVRHVLLFCPRHEDERQSIIKKIGTRDLNAILNHPKHGKLAARWLTRSGLLVQFNTAVQIDDGEEELEALPDINQWTV